MRQHQMMTKIYVNVMDTWFIVITSASWGTINSRSACSIILYLVCLKDDVFDVQAFAILLKERKKTNQSNNLLNEQKSRFFWLKMGTPPLQPKRLKSRVPPFILYTPLADILPFIEYAPACFRRGCLFKIFSLRALRLRGIRCPREVRSNPRQQRDKSIIFKINIYHISLLSY